MRTFRKSSQGPHRKAPDERFDLYLKRLNGFLQSLEKSTSAATLRFKDLITRPVLKVGVRKAEQLSEESQKEASAYG